MATTVLLVVGVRHDSSCVLGPIQLILPDCLGQGTSILPCVDGLLVSHHVGEPLREGLV